MTAEGLGSGLVEGVEQGVLRPALTREHVGDGTYAYLAPKVHLPKGVAGREIPALAKRLGAGLVVGRGRRNNRLRP